MRPLVVFDLETTGLDKVKDQIIQFAGIKVDRETNKILDSYDTYVQPIGNYEISIQAFFKHGIKPDFLKDKPHFIDIAPKLWEFMKDCDILTYNGCGFDMPFIINEFKKVGMDVSFDNVDCYDAFAEEKRRNGNKLHQTYERYAGKTMEEAGLKAHDALSDVKATYSIFYAQQHKQNYGPEIMFGDDNVIGLNEFMGKEVPCFNIGKYKGISVEFVCEKDMNYINWTLGDSCNFSPKTKEFIKSNIKK